MKQKFKWLLAIVATVASVNAFAAAGDLLCGGSFVGSFPNSEVWEGSDEDYYSGNGYKFDQDETLKSPDLPAGVKKVKIEILVGHNGGATSTLVAGAFDEGSTQLDVTENIVPTVAYTAQKDDAIQEYTLDGGSTDIKYVQLSFTKVKNYGMKTFKVYDATGGATVILDSIVIKGTATKMEYEVGEAFDPTGLEVWGIYTKIMKHDSTSQIKNGITWTLDPETFEEASDNASVTLVASYKDQTTTDTTITGINVIPAVKRIEATIAFSNTLFGVVVGNNEKEQSVTKDDVTIVSGCKSTASTKTSYQAAHVRYYADSYLKLSAPNGFAITEVQFTADGNWDDTGISVNVGTYTADSKTWTGKNKSIEFSFSKQCRVGSIKVTCVETPPAAENPTITADTVAEVYFEPITVTLACATEGADIYYTTDGSEPTASATKYTAPFSVTATTTVKAIAMKGGLDNSEVVSKTFTFGEVYATLADLVNAGEPKGQTVKVTLTNEEILSLVSTNGIMLQATKDKQIEIYKSGRPTDWVVGGSVSGTLACPWKKFNDTWELCPSAWTELTYKDPVSEADLDSITLSLDKDTLYQNAAFEYNGTVTANYSDKTSKEVKSATFTGYDMATLGDQVVTVSYTEGEVTKTAQYTLTVIEKVIPAGYAAVYTSNVDFTTEGGDNATISKVVVAKGDTVAAIKCGTGSKDGKCVITIPAATKTLHFHAVAWTGKPLTMDVNGTIYNVTPDSGIAGTGTTFTLAGDAYEYYFSYDPKGATVITFTAKSDHRFVLFGVNAELPEGVVSAPVITAASTEFDESVEVSLSCETEGAEIYYTLDGSEPTASATKYEAPFTLTATTTVKAIAIKEGKASEIAEKTFTKTVFASLEELVTNMPATSNKVTVTVTLTDVVIDSFAVSGQYTNGIFVTAANTAIELYTYDVPATWEEGGKVSGTIKAEWLLYKGVAELQKWDGGWQAFTYAAPVSESALESITLSVDKDTLYQNKEFKYSGTVTANYEDETTKNVTKKATFTGYDMATLGDQVVTVSYTEGEVTKTAQYTLTVIEKVIPAGYASIYTSNVEFTAEGGTKATLSKVVVAEGDTVDAIKCGTSSVDGICVITVPAATKTLHFHAIGWSGKPLTMDVNGTEYNVMADSGISGNGSTYTLAGDAYDYYFSYDPKGATTITFTAGSDHRFVLFGVNTELEEGAIAAPTFTPSATDFGESVEVSLSCETEGAEIFYTLDGSEPTASATKYEAPFTLTATTTVKAIAIKEGKASEIAEKTYTQIPVYTLAEIVAVTPQGQKAILVLDDEEIVEVYTKDGKDGLSGIYFQVGDMKIELYQQNYALPISWAVGGKVSGSVLGEWTDYNGQWELKIAQDQVKELQYTAPSGWFNAKAAKAAKKVIMNGQFLIHYGEKQFNAQGILVR